MLTKTKTALAAALLFGSASVALAGTDGSSQAEGGFDTLSNGQSVETAPAMQSYTGNGGNAYGYVAPNRTTSPHHASHKPTQDR